MPRTKSGGNRGRRKPKISLIQTSRCYTIDEIGKRLDRKVSTVREWIKQGLPVMADTRPRLIDGAVLKVWLKEKWSNRKRSCRVNELFCCRCREPRSPRPDSVQTSHSLSPTTVCVRGKCKTCGTVMQQTRKLVDLPEILSAMRGQTKAKPNLTGYRDPNVKPTLLQGQGAFDFEQHERGSDSVH